MGSVAACAQSTSADYHSGPAAREFFFSNDPAPPEISALSLPDPLPASRYRRLVTAVPPRGPRRYRREVTAASRIGTHRHPPPLPVTATDSLAPDFRHCSVPRSWLCLHRCRVDTPCRARRTL